jgi:putative ABC transport system substrate-binding protein
MQFGQLKRREFIAAVGSAAAWPLAARAQQASMPVVGFLSGSSFTERTHLIAAFRRGLSETGYVEPGNVRIEFGWAEGAYDRLPVVAEEFVRRQVTVIVAGDGPSALVAKAATTTIPIVFNTGIDPIEGGLVKNLSRPEGNLTGYNLIAGPLAAKQFGLLRELVSKGETIALIINPRNANADRDAALVQEAARASGTPILVMKAVVEGDLETIFATLAREQARGLMVNSDVFFTSRRDLLVSLAARYVIPMINPWREFPLAGGLMSYGPSISTAYHQIGVYAGKILAGAKPADLPVIQPTKFELVINLKTAKALALEIPPGVLAIADEVIE